MRFIFAILLILACAFPAAAWETTPPLGFRPLPAEVASALTREPELRGPLAGSLDWRDAGIITPPRDQQDCGGCWAFAAIGCLEAMCLKAGSSRPQLDLSEQYLLSCDTAEFMGVQNDGCCGGTVTTFEFLTQHPAALEATLPFGNGDYDGTGPRSCTDAPTWSTIPCPGALSPTSGWRVATWDLLPGIGDPPVPLPAMLKGALTEGPVWLGFYVYEDFVDYWLHGDPALPYTGIGGAYLGGHAVLVIGYDDAQACWIVKNSWGMTGPFGDGTFRVAYANQCSFGINAATITVEGSDPPLRACCTAADCQLLTEAECLGLGGSWVPDMESCTPNPCTTPAAQRSIGGIKGLFR